MIVRNESHIEELKRRKAERDYILNQVKRDVFIYCQVCKKDIRLKNKKHYETKKHIQNSIIN